MQSKKPALPCGIILFNLGWPKIGLNRNHKFCVDIYPGYSFISAQSYSNEMYTVVDIVKQLFKRGREISVAWFYLVATAFIGLLLIYQ